MTTKDIDEFLMSDNVLKSQLHSYEIVRLIEETENIEKYLTIENIKRFKLNKGDVVILNGDLGAGKTALVAGVASFWNKENDVASPTFTIVNEIVLTNNLSLFHFDVYRLADEDEFYAIGGEEYFDKGITFMEWGNTIKSALPKEYLEIQIDKDLNDDNIRVFNLIPHGKQYEELVERI